MCHCAASAHVSMARASGCLWAKLSARLALLERPPTETALLLEPPSIGIHLVSRISRYTSPLVCGYAWMPDRKGMVSGLVLAGFGASAAVFDMLATAVVNPRNASPDPTTGYYGKVKKYGVVRLLCHVLAIFASKARAWWYWQRKPESPTVLHKCR